jgi:hypothetical protein
VVVAVDAEWELEEVEMIGVERFVAYVAKDVTVRWCHHRPVRRSPSGYLIAPHGIHRTHGAARACAEREVRRLNREGVEAGVFLDVSWR